MTKTSTGILACLIALFQTLNAQNNLSLQGCLQAAVENNLQLRQGNNQLEINEVAWIQQKFAFLPSVNAGLSLGKSFGTFVDNFTQQIATSPYTGSPNLGATFSLFEGMAKWHSLKRSEYDLVAAKYSLEDLKNDIRLSVATAFFQTLYAEDQSSLAEQRLELLAQQLEKVEAQVAAGTKTQGDLVAIKAQIATEKSTLIQQKNAYRKSLLNLLQAMNFDTQKAYLLQRPNLDSLSTNVELPTTATIFADAVANNPGLRAKSMEVLSRKYGISAARALYFPRLVLSYGMGSFYSSNNRPILGVEPGPSGTIIPVYGDAKPLWTQMEENFGQSLNLGISVPLFSNFNIRSSVTAARVGHANALLAEENERNELFKAIEQAYLDADAAKAQLEANKEQLENATLAYSYAQARFEAGLMDFYTLMDFLNNKTRAEVARVQGQYDLLLKQKILELYKGTPFDF
jgi:outer membrane protein